MKLLIIIDDLVNGGTENVLASRLKNLPREHEVHIIALYALGPIADILKKKGFNVDFLDLEKLGYRKGIKAVKARIAQDKFDLALCMRDVCRGLFPWFLKKQLSVAMFWDNPRIKRSFRQAIAEWFQVKFSKPYMYCCSNITREALVKTYGAKDISVIPNCFDDTTFFPETDVKEIETVKIISVGNIREEKKHADKIMIAAKLKEREFDFKMEIIGQGDSRELKSLIEKHGLGDLVFLPGEKNDIHQQLRNSQIFLFTSQTEGFPVSLLEAMASGLPCVTYQFPGLEEVDLDFSHCEVVAQGDIDTAAEKIIYFTEHPEEGRALGKRAAEHVNQFFAAGENTKQWEEYLLSLIEKQH